MPVASAAAEPPLDPPEVRSVFHGLRVAPKTALTVFGPKANSGVLVLPITIAPAVYEALDDDARPLSARARRRGSSHTSS